MRDERPSVIRQILDERGVKYSHFATKIGLPHAVAFYRIESGEQKPPSDYYERAAEYLQVPVELLRPATPAEVA